MAAENLLETRGAFELSLRGTAQLAGVSHNAPYRHFKSKSALIDELLQKTLRDLAERILAAPLLYPVSLTMQVQHVGRWLMQMAWRSPKRAHLLFSYQNHDEIAPPLAAAFEVARQNLALILGESHELRSDAPVDTLAFQLMANWRGLALTHTSRLHQTQISSEENMFEMADSFAENILKSFMH